MGAEGPTSEEEDEEQALTRRLVADVPYISSPAFI